MPIFAAFDRIRIINLPSRRDRRREMQAELRRLNMANDRRVEFVDGIVARHPAPFRTIGEKGVFLAHLCILKEAAKHEQSVLILEDDVDFVRGAELWCRATDCDIAYGGYLASNSADLVNSDIIGAHCMGFSARVAKELAPFLEQLLTIESSPPIDGAYVWFRRRNPQFTTSFSNIAVQRPSRSDIAPLRLFDRIRLIRGLVRVARHIKRQLRRKELTFGLPEATAVALIGIIIASAAAYYYVQHPAVH